MDYGQEGPTLTISDSGTNTVTLNMPEGGVTLAKKSTTQFYIVLPPQVYRAGAEIRIKADGREDKIIRLETPLSIERSKITAGSTVFFEEQKPATGINLNDASLYDTPSSGDVYSNCYRIDQAGSYFFDATVIGNGDAGLLSGTGFHTQTTRISPKSAAMLWEDAQGTVTNVSLSDGGTFLLFDAAATPGNAVIAVYDGEDATGNILWSWHIWVSEKPRDQQYKNAQGANTYLVMDRNLGAVFTPASITVDDINALTDDQRYATYGLGYQWGRKDPFVGCSAVVGLKDKVMYGSITKIKKVKYTATGDEANNNLLYAVQNPVTFILNPAFGSWNVTPVANLWGNPQGYETNYPKGTKTIYDPCPVGYMVPPANLWAASDFDKNPIKLKPNNSKGNKGRVFYYDGVNMAWYPVAGARWADDGTISDVGTGSGNYWSNSVLDATGKLGSCFIYAYVSGSVYLIQECGVAYGLNVRCVRE